MKSLRCVFIKLILVIYFSTFLFGCAPQKFQIVPLGDKFSDPSTPNGYIGKFNRLSTKSSKGGTHIDDKGVYLDPFVYKKAVSNEIESVGFVVAHFNFEVYDGFRPIQEIVFLTDKGARIKIEVQNHDSDFKVYGWNTIAKDFNTGYRESGIAFISKVDFQEIANSKYLEAKIVGGKMSQIYEQKDISDSFINNLKIFCDNQLK